MWMTGTEASMNLSVDEKNLDTLREEGFLKPGIHWRSSPEPEQLPWNPKVFYCVSRCEEVIESLKHHYSSVDQMAA